MHEVEYVVLLAVIVAIRQVNIQVVSAVYAVVALLNDLTCLLAVVEVVAGSFLVLFIRVIIERSYLRLGSIIREFLYLAENEFLKEYKVVHLKLRASVNISEFYERSVLAACKYKLSCSAHVKCVYASVGVYIAKYGLSSDSSVYGRASDSYRHIVYIEAGVAGFRLDVYVYIRSA